MPAMKEQAPENWLTLEEAVKAYELSERTLRRRLTARQLDGIKVHTPSGREWRVRPPGPDNDRTASGSSGQGDPGTNLDRIRVSDIEQLLAPLAKERDILRAELEREREARLQETRQAAEARLTDREEIGRLRGLLEATQSEVQRLRAGEVPATPPPGTSGIDNNVNSSTSDEPARRRLRWPWQRHS